MKTKFIVGSRDFISQNFNLYKSDGVQVIFDFYGNLRGSVTNDLSIIDFSDSGDKVGLNIFSKNDDSKFIDYNINSFIQILKDLYDPHDQGIIGPRFIEKVIQVCQVVKFMPNPNIYEVYKCLHDEKYLFENLKYVKDTQLVDYWNSVVSNEEKFHKSEVYSYILSKFIPFVTNSLLYELMNSDTLSIRKILDSKKGIYFDFSNLIFKKFEFEVITKFLVKMIEVQLLDSEDSDINLFINGIESVNSTEFKTLLEIFSISKDGYIVSSSRPKKINDSVFDELGHADDIKVGELKKVDYDKVSQITDIP